MPAAEMFAIGSAVAFAFTNLIVKKALRAFSSPFSAIVTFFSATVAIWAVTISLGYELPSSAYSFAAFRPEGSA